MSPGSVTGTPANPYPEEVVDEARILHTLNRSVADKLALGAFIVAGVYAALAPLQIWTLGPMGTRVAAAAAITSAALLALGFRWRHRPPEAEKAQSRVALLVGVVLANDTLFHWIVASPYQTIGLSIELLCAAVLITSRVWFGAVVAATWVVFATILARHGPSPEFTPPLILLASATALAVILQAIRALQLHRVAAARLEAADARAEQEQSEERYRQLAEHAFDMIVELDDERLVTYANPRVAELLGYPPEELIGTHSHHWMPALMDPSEYTRLRQILSPPAEYDHVGQLSTKLRHVDGTWRWVEFTLRSFRTATGSQRFVVIGRDTTEQHATHAELEARVQERTAKLEHARSELERLNQSLKKMQSRRIRAERLGAAEDLAASVVHAINNPLAALYGHLQLANERSPSDTTVRRALRLTGRIRDVVEHTLTLFREGALDLAPVDIRALMSELANDLEASCHEHGIDLQVKVEAGLPRVRADRALLAAVLGGLAQNSIDAMHHGGTLGLDAVRSNDRGVISLRVTDTGPGIPTELRHKAIEPFFTTKSGGTGLGLAIAESVARGHQGRLQIGERPGGGALVALQLLVPESQPPMG